MFVFYKQIFLGEGKINIISNVLIQGPTNSEELVKKIFGDIIDSALNISEKNKEKQYTKKGTLRKRKKIDTSVKERKNSREKE